MDASQIAEFIVAHGLPAHLAGRRNIDLTETQLRQMVAPVRYDPPSGPYPRAASHSIGNCKDRLEK